MSFELLLVEDDPSIRTVLQDAMQTDGHATTVAADGDEALAIRSLALLNTPESLPYLIDWTKDQNAEIQAAARQAIAMIHQKGQTTEVPDKK